MTERIIAGAAVLGVFLLFPGWAAFLCGVVLAFVFPLYVELFFVGLALDMIESAPVPSLGNFEHFFLASSLAVLALAWLARRFFRIYPKHE